MVVNNFGCMSSMFSIHYKLIYFIGSIKLLFCNVFVGHFDY